MTRVVLASGSYQRQRLLAMLGVEYETVQSGFDEHLIRQSDFTDLGDYVSAIAVGKVMEVSGRINNGKDVLVLGGDLLCFAAGNRALGKPSSLTQARQYLDQLSGNWHHEVSAIALWSETKGLKRLIDHIDLFLPPLTETEKTTYLQLASPLNKAGGFSLAAYAKILISRGEDPRQTLTIAGSVTGVLGFPVRSVAKLLAEYGHPVAADAAALEKRLEDDILAGKPL